MGVVKRKSRAKSSKKRVQQHKSSMLGICGVILLLVVVVSINSITLRAKNQSYKAQEAELKAQIELEEERAAEIEELEAYVSTDAYIEQVAKDKLGLLHDNEIIFKAK